MSELPDYYAILEVAPTATDDDIKRAYKKSALKWHPDRVPSDSPERPRRTKMFQRINDAYYTLSNSERRRDYDDARRFQGTAHFDEEADEEIPRQAPPSGDSWLKWAANMFWGGSATAQEQTANEQFKGAFEEMMAEDNMADEDAGKKVPNRRFWSIVGGVAGASLGFILGDVIGAAPGFLIGSQAGKIRDTKGKSVYQVFQSLDQDKKARILSELAAKLFSGAIS